MNIKKIRPITILFIILLCSLPLFQGLIYKLMPDTAELYPYKRLELGEIIESSVLKGISLDKSNSLLIESDDAEIVIENSDDIKYIKSIKLSGEFNSETPITTFIVFEPSVEKALNDRSASGIKVSWPSGDKTIAIASDISPAKAVCISLREAKGVRVSLKAIEFNDNRLITQNRSKALKNRLYNICGLIILILMGAFFYLFGKNGFMLSKPTGIISIVICVGMFITGFFIESKNSLLVYLTIGSYILSMLAAFPFIAHKSKTHPVGFIFALCLLAIALLFCLKINYLHYFFIFTPLYFSGFNDKKGITKKQGIFLGFIFIFTLSLLFSLSKGNNDFILRITEKAFSKKDLVTKDAFIIAGTVLLWFNSISFAKLTAGAGKQLKGLLFPLIMGASICYLYYFKGSISTSSTIGFVISTLILEFISGDFRIKEAKGDTTFTNSFIACFISMLIPAILYCFVMALSRYHFEEYTYTTLFALIKSVVMDLKDANGIYNLILLYMVYFFFWAILRRCGVLIFYILYGLLIFGSFVKLSYHGTPFMPADLLQLRDFYAIARLSPAFWVIVILAVISFIFASIYIIRAHKKRPLKMRPGIFVIDIISFILLASIMKLELLTSADIAYSAIWLGDSKRLETQGLCFFNYYNITTLDEIIPRKPQGYSEDSVNALKERFPSAVSDEEIKPDVIVIMNESMFDITEVDGLSFKENVASTIQERRSGTVISPAFGGSTANVEFEALTGCSNYFLADNVSPYVTYWSKSDSRIPSIAHQFLENGYATIAIHPNKKRFYNRENIYRFMGFEEFFSIEDFPADAEIVSPANKFVTDKAFLEYLTDYLDNKSDDRPQFIFGITIQNHLPFTDRIEENERIITSEKDLSQSALDGTEAYSARLKKTDEFIAELISYVENTSTPTNLYIWGDHLPSLSALTALKYTDDAYCKYSTPLIAYSNYKTLTPTDEAITPNQIAPLVLKDSLNSYSSYFDYIATLPPVIHKDFTSESLTDYELLQYDLLFGEQYALKNDK